MLVPAHGLTGYYLYIPEEENVKLSPIKIPPQEIVSGLRKKVYEGRPEKTLIEETAENSPINFEWHSEGDKPYQAPFTIEWNGLLKIEHRGDYTFILGSDDGSELFLNGKLIIDNGGLHGLAEKRQTTFLEPGFYRLHVRYFDQGGGAILYLKWRFLETSEAPIPSSQFYQKRNQGLNIASTTLPYVLEIEPDESVEEANVVFLKKDASVVFSNYRILKTHYVNYWNNSRFEPPPDMPPYNILWRGKIWIPKEGMYTFKTDTNGDMFLFIGEESVIRYHAGSDSEARIHLNKGWKPVQINYYNTTRYATLNVLWQKPEDNKFRNIPSGYFLPLEDTGTFEYTKLWCGICFISIPVSILLGIFLWLRNTIKCHVQQYFMYVRQNWPAVALLLIVILGAVLRLHNYSVSPPHGDTMDAYQEAWNGFHILHGEGPKSWEGGYFVSAYKTEDKKFLQWLGDDFLIVNRYIAHPPLFSIFAGIPPILCGAKTFLDCRLTTIRLTPIFFSTVTIILVFLVSYKIYRSNTISIVASLLYATVPFFVAAGRIPKGDGLLALVLITGVLCVLKYTESKKTMYVIFAGVLAGTSFWCKEMGICAVLILPLLLGRNGFIKEASLVAGIGFFIATNYMLYNYLINPDAFFKMLSLRDAHQSTVFDMVVRYLREPRLTLSNANFGMGYLLWFWFVLVYSMRKHDPIVPTTAFIFLMTVCALSTSYYPFGWFLVPIYPFMAIAGGLFIRDFISKPNTARALLLILVPIAVPLAEVLPKDLQNVSWLFRYYLAIGILPFLALDFLKNRFTAMTAKIGCYTLVSFFIIMNIYIVYHLTDVYNPL